MILSGHTMRFRQKLKIFLDWKLPDFIVYSLRNVTMGKVRNVQVIDNIMRKFYCITFIQYEYFFLLSIDL